jgi:hypothetical protein
VGKEKMKCNTYKTNIRDCENPEIFIKEWLDKNYLRLVIKDKFGHERSDIYIEDIIKWVIKFKPEYMEGILQKHPIEKYKTVRHNPFLDPEIIEKFESFLSSQNEPQKNIKTFPSDTQDQKHEDKKKDQCNQDASYNQDQRQLTSVKQENPVPECPPYPQSSESSIRFWYVPPTFYF